LNACRVPIRVQQLSSAAIRWVRLHFMHLRHLERPGIATHSPSLIPVFFNSPGELAALLSRHATQVRHAARAESNQQLMKRVVMLAKRPLPNW
jgi:hypothetical protein